MTLQNLHTCFNSLPKDRPEIGFEPATYNRLHAQRESLRLTDGAVRVEIHGIIAPGSTRQEKFFCDWKVTIRGFDQRGGG